MHYLFMVWLCKTLCCSTWKLWQSPCTWWWPIWLIAFCTATASKVFQNWFQNINILIVRWELPEILSIIIWNCHCSSLHLKHVKTQHKCENCLLTSQHYIFFVVRYTQWLIDDQSFERLQICHMCCVHEFQVEWCSVSLCPHQLVGFLLFLLLFVSVLNVLNIANSWIATTTIVFLFVCVQFYTVSQLSAARIGWWRFFIK